MLSSPVESGEWLATVALAAACVEQIVAVPHQLEIVRKCFPLPLCVSLSVPTVVSGSIEPP